MVALPLGLPLYMILLSVFVLNAAYFFLFGQEWWRLVKRFRSPPRWIRIDVQAAPLTLNRTKHESKKTTFHRQIKRSRQAPN